MPAADKLKTEARGGERQATNTVDRDQSWVGKSVQAKLPTQLPTHERIFGTQFEF
jgi:hypothetical protein